MPDIDNVDTMGVEPWDFVSFVSQSVAISVSKSMRHCVRTTH